MNDHDEVLSGTRYWLEHAVIGLNLCPFVKAVHQKGQIRWVHSRARTRQRLMQVLMQELARLRDADPQLIETTVIIHPQVLRPFARYNDFLDLADTLLHELRLTGVVQIASFHPQYQFADAPPGDISHCTNRSPYPMLHLLRESSVARAVQTFPDASLIFERNVQTLRQLGWPGWQRLMRMR